MAAQAPANPYTEIIKVISAPQSASFNINNSLAINLLVAGINLAILTQKVLILQDNLICEGIPIDGKQCKYKKRGAITIAVFAGTVSAALILANLLYVYFKDMKVKDKFWCLRVASLLSLVGSGMVLFLISAFSEDLKIDPTFYAALAAALIESSRNYFEVKGDPETVAPAVVETNPLDLEMNDSDFKHFLADDVNVRAARTAFTNAAATPGLTQAQWDAYSLTFETAVETALDSHIQLLLSNLKAEADEAKQRELAADRLKIREALQSQNVAIRAITNNQYRQSKEIKLFSAFEDALYARVKKERKLAVNIHSNVHTVSGAVEQVTGTIHSATGTITTASGQINNATNTINAAVGAIVNVPPPPPVNGRLAPGQRGRV